MEAVIQEETSGCGIAASAALAGVPYPDAKRMANSLGIHAEDKALWSDTRHVRTLLSAFQISTSPVETSFESWESLPDTALLAIKWRLEEDRAFWHWVVFIRRDGDACVLDSRKSLKSHVRQDFWRMKPKWYIEVFN
ncbi:hypothetical protein [Halomonas elongata]|uniref:Peptidase C39 domain-containing protein n=2 Tax=Halomonas elongata TaxID=2746 RepID=A0A1B8P551_HALEL|nr:hypothetical protein [Halomonas elongata]OBX37395.1 hypothetical protein A8U91_01759 [Halomonas elongata]